MDGNITLCILLNYFLEETGAKGCMEWRCDSRDSAHMYIHMQISLYSLELIQNLRPPPCEFVIEQVSRGSLRSLPGACVELEASRRKGSDHYLSSGKPVPVDLNLSCSAAEEGVWHYPQKSLYRIVELNHNSYQKERASLKQEKRELASLKPKPKQHPWQNKPKVVSSWKLCMEGYFFNNWIPGQCVY